jgi:predicted nucleic acid-binding protein
MEPIAKAVIEHGAIVPALWRWEVQNALVVAARRGRITPDAIVTALTYFRALPIEVDPIGAALTFGAEIETAQRFSLSAYDAAYLDLALRRGVLVATADGNLGRAAEHLKIRWSAGARRPATPKRSR